MTSKQQTNTSAKEDSIQKYKSKEYYGFIELIFSKMDTDCDGWIEFIDINIEKLENDLLFILEGFLEEIADNK